MNLLESIIIVHVRCKKIINSFDNEKAINYIENMDVLLSIRELQEGPVIHEEEDGTYEYQL